MKKYVNGKYIPLTQEEIEAMQQVPPETPAEPDLETQLAQLKEQVGRLQKALDGELADKTAALKILGVADA